MCGSGGCLASAPLVQNKSYFEVKLQQSGVWGCGVATRSADVNAAPGGHDSESWVLCSDLCIRHSQNSIHKINVQIQEGDVIVSIESNNSMSKEKNSSRKKMKNPVCFYILFQ